MTEVAFHFNASDKLGYACRLLRKGYKSGAKLTVVGPATVLDELDQRLWTFEALEFVPHVRLGDAASAALASSAAADQQANDTPVLLTTAASASVHHDVLVNLGVDVPDGFERFLRLIEVVSRGEADRQAGRVRWKHYAERGYSIERHEVEP